MGWSDVEDVDASKGIYAVCGQLWSVGPRYKLQAHVGSGSYGDVCRAMDLEFGQTVALKRVPDVFFCQMLAKRVLREVCIMRRLAHPYIISLTDVFSSKNLEKPDSTDLYIATEFAERGDLYHQAESITAETVRTLIWQLLVAVHYMHTCHVWHRDIKSENVLLTGNLQAKLCDFGLSRSALETSSQVDAKPTGRRKRPVLQRQYTKTVVTPSHRAPEVVMSQGQYTSAIDMWSLGCIFWELLMRQSRPHHCGPVTKPLFGVRGEPSTPSRGETYNSDISSELHDQLDVIFNVIGTPCWKDIESVPSEHWRAYLKKVPGRAGNIVKQFTGLIDDNALDLLQRMLAFAPQRRCTADEALFHTYFKGMNVPLDVSPIPLVGKGPSALSDHPVWKITEPAVALGLLERELELSANHVDGGKLKLEQLLQCEIEQQQMQTSMQRAALRSLASKGFFDRSAFPAAAPAKQSQPPREIQLFPCAISRATGSSTGSLSNQSELWSVEERSDQADWQTDGEPQRGSNDSVVSHEPSRPAGLASSLGSILYDGASVQENELPPTKRQRKMTISAGKAPSV
ncbi:mitogen-activated protein kinase mpkB isoform X1 [Physcomitrium patens]|uniref:Protein kinase domain-containing protein n=2 Tax=Physcomitrium patens TaxID=3218 RepID=A0A2K1L912_PHYPA|nr:mitogen-activated protein kinase 3-like isoform X2 [Physcomitrium patens]PNR62529.1 hypothetical protein PHYPA_000953 [Physcomitrium patens]|eukprot:XP_024380588.1 mitogen-activated protein kinase 3-like isoform X2 [Physcomitrella patens]